MSNDGLCSQLYLDYDIQKTTAIDLKTFSLLNKRYRFYFYLRNISIPKCCRQGTPSLHRSQNFEGLGFSSVLDTFAHSSVLAKLLQIVQFHDTAIFSQDLLETKINT